MQKINYPVYYECLYFLGSYQILKTEEIPTLADPTFRPKVIEEFAHSLIQFLQSNCTKDAATYWLTKVIILVDPSLPFPMNWLCLYGDFVLTYSNRTREIVS